MTNNNDGSISLDRLNALLKDLASTTRSPGQQSNLLIKFFASEGLFDNPGAQEVMAIYEKAMTKQREDSSRGGANKNGPSSGKKVAKVKAPKATYGKPMFVSDYVAGQCCAVCHEKIKSGNAFRWRQGDGSYDDYHALPGCFPEEHKHHFQQNKLYIRTITY